MSGSSTCKCSHNSMPVQGAQVTQGSAVLLYAQALDLKDGNLAYSNFTWSSDRDGALGTGEQIIIQNLSLGVHTLTVDAVNSDGLHALQSVQMEVVPVPPVQVEPLPGSDPALGWLLGLGSSLGGLVVLGMFVLRIRRRCEGGGYSDAVLTCVRYETVSLLLFRLVACLRAEEGRLLSLQSARILFITNRQATMGTKRGKNQVG